MTTVRTAIVCLLAMVLLSFVCDSFAEQSNLEYFPSFPDEHTVGLWLFDEIDYPYTTITDASQYEYDLRLMKGGQLVKGKFGNCLKCTPGLDYAVGYSSWKGHVSFAHLREVSGRPGSGLWGPTVAPEKLLAALNGHDFTCEFWLMLMSNPIQDVSLVDMGDRYQPGFRITLKRKAAGFVIENSYAGFTAFCPSVLNQLWGRAWHHVAFCYSSASKKFEYFIDGKVQTQVTVSAISQSTMPPTIWQKSLNHTTYGIFEKAKNPKKPTKVDKTAIPDFEKRRKHRFNFSVGQRRNGKLNFNGNIDELRFSDVVRYVGDFHLPDSFSRNYRKNASKPSVPNGPPLLFGPEKKYKPNEPVMLGYRKHVFIDEVMVDRKQAIRLTVNPLTKPQKTSVRVKGGMDIPFFDHEGKIWMILKRGYAADVGRQRLVISEDGINFKAPDLGLIEDGGSKHNNIIITHMPSWGRFFKDTNPNAPLEEKFKFTAWVAQRGIYLYLSPDAIHWRRNETCMLPLVSGGGCETFWDDQQGMYFNYIKRDGSYSTGDYPAYGRSYCLFKTRQVTKPWPFNRVSNPYYEGWAFPAVTGEGITVMGPDLMDPDKGQVFRTRARKYEWAPDTYVGFLQRNPNPPQLAVSRDALNWHIFDRADDGPYVPRTSDSGKIAVGYIQDGMVRRGDEIWQYVNLMGQNVTRFSQRLDGFVSLDAGAKTGIIITKPFIFQGAKLTLNVDASKGSLRTALLDLTGKEISGYNIALTDPPKKDVRCYTIEQCDEITNDSVRQIVTWRKNSDLSNLAGQIVRLRFEMQNAKLYAFQFK